jgi:ABC-type sugar transport system ATPase subunit
MDEVLLGVRNLSKIFPGTMALEDVSIQFRRAEIHGIIGKNGAGKSTLLNILSGILPPSSGQIIIRGNEFARLTTARAKKEGITIVTQKPEVVPDFTVVQNFFLPQFVRNRFGFLKWQRMRAETERIFAEAGLHIDVKRRMRDLSLDEEQIFLLLKAFGVDKKEFILLDEVTTSFSRKEQEFFFRLIEDQKSKGNLIIFISHRLDEMMRICDRVTVLRDGKAVGTLEKRELSKDLLASMVVGAPNEKPLQSGNSSETFGPAVPSAAPAKKRLLSVRGYCRAGYFENVSFDLHEGEIVGLAGLVGSGRTELLRAIQGIEAAEQGTLILHDGKHARFTSSRAAINGGIVYLTENRDEDGLINIHSVKKNLTLSFLISVARQAWIQKQGEQRLADSLVETFEIVTSSLDEEVQNLSGGNRQKVMLGRVASTRAKVLLLDEPTKGIDISAKRSVLKSIRNSLAQNAGIIITSPGLEDLLEVCDRILILVGGTISQEFLRNEFDELTIYRAIQGIE